MSLIEVLKSTDVDITITVTGIDLADITAMTVSLEKSGYTAIPLTIAGGQVTVGATTINVRIEDTVLTTAGIYNVRITATENGNLRGLKSDPSFITVI